LSDLQLTVSKIWRKL